MNDNLIRRIVIVEAITFAAVLIVMCVCTWFVVTNIQQGAAKIAMTQEITAYHPSQVPMVRPLQLTVFLTVEEAETLVDLEIAYCGPKLAPGVWKYVGIDECVYLPKWEGKKLTGYMLNEHCTYQ